MTGSGSGSDRRAAERDALFVAARAAIAEHQERFQRVGELLDRLTLEAVERTDDRGAEDAAIEAEWERKRFGDEGRPVKTADDPQRRAARCMTLAVALTDSSFQPIAGYLDPTAPAPIEERLDGAAALLLAVLIVGDPDLHECVGSEVSVLATLPWYGGESEGANFVMGRCMADCFGREAGVWEPSEDMLDRIRVAVSMFRPSSDADGMVAPRDSGEPFLPFGRFPVSWQEKLKKAASPDRGSKRVRTRIVDGVRLYSVGDAERWWGPMPDD